MNRLSTGEKIVGAASALLLILSFLPMWAKYETATEGFEEFGVAATSTSQRFNAWSGAYGILLKLALILALIALVVVIIRAVSPQTLGNMPLPLGLLYLILGGLTALLIIIQTVMGPAGQELSGNFFGASFEVSRGPLLFAGAVLGLAMAAGGFLHKQQEGSATPAGRPLGGGPAGPRPGPGPAGPPPPPGPGL